ALIRSAGGELAERLADGREEPWLAPPARALGPQARGQGGPSRGGLLAREAGNQGEPLRRRAARLPSA
ncbi:MAG: hypothetical protein WBP81_08670, partial [Solirubrobacteraceae bacterium]